MIHVIQLTKDFGKFRAVDQISFTVNAGEILGFMGPNGAGKSTTMRMIAGVLPPSSGTAEVCGHDILKDSVRAREKIGYLPESAPSYNEMLIREFLLFAGAVRGLSGTQLQKRVDHVLEMTALRDVQFALIETLSKGYRQRTCLAQALMADPPVLIFDEPTDGLDPNQKHEVRALIQRMSEKRAILISTHILEEVEAVCTRAIIIAQGQIVADGTPEELLAQSSYYHAVSLTVNHNSIEDLIVNLRKITGVTGVRQLPSKTMGSASFLLFPEQGTSILEKVENFVHQQRLHVEQLYLEKGHLDEVFRKVTLQPHA